MANLGDLRLDKPAAELPPPEPRGPGLRVMVMVVVAIVLVIAGYLAVRRRPAAPAPTPSAQQAGGPSAVPPARERGENIPLPPLDETDPLVRDLVGRLSSHPKVVAWLSTKQLIRNFAVVVVNVADGHTPAKHLRTLAPGAPFSASTDSGPGVILPASYVRYDSYADAVDGLDAHGVAGLYATLKPRIQDAYKDLGYPTGDVDEAMTRAFVVLLKTPIVEGPVAVQRSSVSYTFADPRLESLSAAQKQLLRMGPRNVRLIQNKLREIAPLLGIDPGALPAERVLR